MNNRYMIRIPADLTEPITYIDSKVVGVGVAEQELGGLDICSLSAFNNATGHLVVMAVGEYSVVSGEPYNERAHKLYGYSPIHGTAIIWKDNHQPIDIDQVTTFLAEDRTRNG